jgi:hypothetical protein
LLEVGEPNFEVVRLASLDLNLGGLLLGTHVELLVSTSGQPHRQRGNTHEEYTELLVRRVVDEFLPVNVEVCLARYAQPELPLDDVSIQ